MHTIGLALSFCCNPMLNLIMHSKLVLLFNEQNWHTGVAVYHAWTGKAVINDNIIYICMLFCMLSLLFHTMHATLQH